jgi:hypothetical protein
MNDKMKPGEVFRELSRQFSNLIDDLPIPNEENMSPEGKYVITELVGEWVNYFSDKQADYKDDGNTFGAMGIVPDIDRKAKKIRRAIWDHQRLAGEQPREILFDMIGHCFLMVAELDKLEEKQG